MWRSQAKTQEDDRCQRTSQFAVNVSMCSTENRQAQRMQGQDSGSQSRVTINDMHKWHNFSLWSSQMSHVTCGWYKRVMSRIDNIIRDIPKCKHLSLWSSQMSHVTCGWCKWVMSHIDNIIRDIRKCKHLSLWSSQMNHVTCGWYEWVMTRIDNIIRDIRKYKHLSTWSSQMNHVTCGWYEWVMSHLVNIIRDIRKCKHLSLWSSQLNHVTYEWYEWVMSHTDNVTSDILKWQHLPSWSSPACVSLDRKASSCRCVTWLIYMCGTTHLCVWKGAFTCVTWLIVTCMIHMCDLTQWHMWDDTFIRVTRMTHANEGPSQRLYVCVWRHSWMSDMDEWLYVCDVTHSYMNEWLYVCDVTHEWVIWMSDCMCVTPLIRTCGMTHSYVLCDILLNSLKLINSFKLMAVLFIAGLGFRV